MAANAKEDKNSYRDDEVVICHAEFISASQATKEDPGSSP